MKRLLILLSVLGLVISASAFGAAVSVPVNQLVTVPIQDAGWHVGAEALYLKTSNSDLDYATVDGSPGAVPDGYAAKINPKYKWGFGLDAGYHFKNTGNDLSVHYERLHNTNSNAVAGTRVWSRFVHPAIEQNYTSANARVEYKYDAFDALLGQLVDVGHKLHTHLTAGVRYADLRSNMNATYSGVLSTEQAILKSSFKGIGPRFTFNGTYDLYRGFNFDAGLGTSLLIGNMKASNQQITNYPTPANYLLTKGSTRHVVPELDAKLGLSYNRLFNKGKLTIMAGWKVINYFDAQDYIIYTDDTAPGCYVHSITNIAYNGPYLGFVFKTA